MEFQVPNHQEKVWLDVTHYWFAVVGGKFAIWTVSNSSLTTHQVHTLFLSSWESLGSSERRCGWWLNVLGRDLKASFFFSSPVALTRRSLPQHDLDGWEPYLIRFLFMQTNNWEETLQKLLFAIRFRMGLLRYLSVPKKKKKKKEKKKKTQLSAPPRGPESTN